MAIHYRPVHVWDGVVRLTHWINAGAIILLLPLGAMLFAASLLIRLAYLAHGEGAASWRDVVPHTQAQLRLATATIRYYLGGCRGECPLYFAHNPLAGLAYTGFFLFASVQVISGAAMYLLGGDIVPAVQAHAGHEHLPANSWPPAWLAEIHEWSALLIALFILAHLTALALHDLVEKRGLASSMISGNKFFSEAEITALDIPTIPTTEKETTKQ